MKKINFWIIILLVLLLLLFIRLSPRIFSSNKLIFKNKNIVGIELKNAKIEFDEKNKNWFVLKQNKIFKANIDEINNLLENIKNLQILEIVSKDKNKFKEYLLDEETSTKVKVFVKKNKKTIPFIVFIGKQGGFSYSEFYARFEKNPYIYITKGINKWLLERPFYDYCDKRILNSEVENLSFIELNYNKKIFKYKKDLQNQTTTWISLKDNKKVEENKIQEFIKNFENFIADGIVLEEDIDSEKLNVIFEIKLLYIDNTEINIKIYNKESIENNTSSFYPVKIKCSNRESQNIKFCAEEEIFYTIYEYKYNQLTEFVKK